MTTPRNPAVRTIAAVVALAALLAACGRDQPDPVLEVTASIDDIALVDAQPDDPLPLSTSESRLSMTMTNRSDREVEVRYLRLEGEMLGLTFLTYTTRVALVLDPGETREVDVPLDFFDIDTQAHGFLRASLRLYAPDAERTRLSDDTFAVDVRGAVTSTMAMFALLLLLLTAATLTLNLQGLARRTLPANRFKRGARFAVSGLGVGLLLSVAFSVLRIFPLPATAWWPLLLVPTLIGFAAGYVAPGPVLDYDEDDLQELTDLDEDDETDDDIASDDSNESVDA